MSTISQAGMWNLDFDGTYKLNTDFAVSFEHSKKGDKEVDIKPLLHSLEMTARNQNELRLVCVLSAQNPGLNPQLLVSAIETYLPERKPDFARICRMEVLDDGNTPFR